VGGERSVLAFPTTYMNASGTAVAALARKHRVGPAEILVAADDMYLPLGRMRIRAGGGDGGHNGLGSVTAALGTREFPRLRLGIGEPPPGEAGVDWVLRPFDREEFELVEAVLDRAVEAFEVVVREGLVRAMDLANRRPDEKGRRGESFGTSL
jgi:PTH1 family peptidyl-tRNA hydrolase